MGRKVGATTKPLGPVIIGRDENPVLHPWGAVIDLLEEKREQCSDLSEVLGTLDTLAGLTLDEKGKCERLRKIAGKLEILKTRRLIWLALYRSSKRRYHEAYVAIVDAWIRFTMGSGYRPSSKKQVRRAVGATRAALRRLISAWTHNEVRLKDITFFDLLPDDARNIDQLNCLDETIPSALQRLEHALDETETRDIDRVVPQNHEAMELAYHLTWMLHNDTKIVAHKAVALFVSEVLDTTVTMAAVKRAWNRSLKEGKPAAE
jgi:hypothetical protein